jgi:trehalose/maltose hydrolase-like predicted phosphorylase
MAHYNPARERYEIHGVMGPDEFHERYPGSAAGGLRNNAYTNVMVAWLCGVAARVLTLLPASRAEALRSSLGIDDTELHRWDDMSRRMFVPFHGDGIISQFEGYDELAELDWDAYRAKYTNIQRLDRILRAEDDDPNRYKLSKQADAVMLFYLFTPDELGGLFERLGYPFHADTPRINIAYYDTRTSHGSTLSLIVHAAVLADIDPDTSWQRFLIALESDVGDVQGGTTKEGIHMGVMSGTLDLVQRIYAGARTRGDTLTFAPRLPDRLEGLSFAMQFRGNPLRVTLAGHQLTVESLNQSAGDSVTVACGEQTHELTGTDRYTFNLPTDPHPTT